MFKINKENFGDLDSVTITNPKHGIELQIINGFGAIINKYIVNHSPFSFISGYQDSEELVNQHPFFSRSAKLFPFPNRLADGRYFYNGTQYQLPANFPWSDHAIHGLLYNQAFELIDSFADTQQAYVTLRYQTDSLHTGYPFAFTLNVTYRLNNEGHLSCSTTIENNGSESLPFGDAWHPYFSLGASLNECLLTMPSSLEVEHVNDLPSGEKRPFNQFSAAASLSGANFNNCYEFESDTVIELTLERTNKTAALYFQQDPSYRFIQLYTPQSEQAIAIEPMTCPADAFNNHIGLLELLPNQSQTFTWQCQAVYRA